MKKPEEWMAFDIINSPEGALKAGVPLAKIHALADTLHQFAINAARVSKSSLLKSQLKLH